MASSIEEDEQRVDPHIVLHTGVLPTIERGSKKVIRNTTLFQNDGWRSFKMTN